MAAAGVVSNRARQVSFPDYSGRGAHADVCAAGIAAHPSDKYATTPFIEHLAKQQTRACFTDGDLEYPVNEGGRLGPVFEEWSMFETNTVSFIDFGENDAEAVKAMDRVRW